MKLLVDASGVGTGGISTYLKAILQNWPKRDQIVVVGLRKSLIAEIELESSIICVPVNTNRLIGILTTFIQILRYQNKADLILLAGPSITSLAYRRKAIAIIHDFMFIDKKEFVSWQSRLYRILSNWSTLNKCQKIVLVSQFTANRYFSLYGNKNRESLILSPTACLSKIMDPIDQVANLIFSGMKIVVVPAHSSNKGSKWAIQSLPYLAPNVVLVLLTGKSKRHEKRDDIGNRIVFLNWISREQYSWLLSIASCMLFLSEYEGFGIPVLECKAVGLPIIISEEPSLVEASQGYASIVKQEDSKQVAEHVNSIMNSDYEKKAFPIPSWGELIGKLSHFAKS